MPLADAAFADAITLSRHYRHSFIIDTLTLPADCFAEAEATPFY